MPRVLISGYYGFGNAGDEAILAAMVAKLKLMLPGIGITVISRNPEATRQEHGVDAIGRFEAPALLGALSRSDVLLSGGGSLLQDITSVRSLAYYLSLMALAKSLGKKVMLFANGYGPVSSPQGMFMARHVLDRIDVATFRDARSLEEVRCLGVTRPRMELTADPVFLLDSLTTPEQQRAARGRAERALEKSGIPLQGGPLVGVSLRSWKHASPEFPISVKNALQLLAQAGARVLLLPLHQADDLPFSEQLAGGLLGQGIYVLRDRLDARAMMEIMPLLDMVVAMRLHALIFAVTKSTPCAAIPYDPKVSSFVDAIGLPVASDVERPSAEIFYKTVEETLSKKQHIAGILETRRNQQREIANRNFEIVAELLSRA